MLLVGGEPGIGMEAAKWFIDKGISLTGADTWATEVVPNPNKDLAFPVHAELIAKNGIFNHENLFFDELLKDRKFQFVYIFATTPMKGATGSAGAPAAGSGTDSNTGSTSKAMSPSGLGSPVGSAAAKS